MPRVTQSRSGTRSLTLVEDDAGADCASQCAAADDVLVVALSQRPREWLAARDPAPVSTRFVATYPHPDCVRVLSDPGDLTGAAVAVTRFLHAIDPGATPAVCLDSLSALLESAPPTGVARFLAVVAARVRAAGGSVHCHGDPDDVADLPASGLLGDGSLAADASAD